MTEADTLQSAAEVQPVDQSAGMEVIAALSKVWGDNPQVVGDFIGRPGCPSYLEGMYFDEETLVFQVRGDTVQARQELELAAGSGAFRLEQADDSLFSQKDLDALMDQVARRLKRADERVRANVQGYGTGVHTLDVWLILNTPERRRDFRRQVIDSPALRFSGSSGQELCCLTGTDDTLGVSLFPEQVSLPANARSATFLLVNNGTEQVTCGEHYTMAYERDGQWYELPINGMAVDIAYILSPGKTHRFSGGLFPLVNDNRPGRYRFFTRVDIGDRPVQMMAEFRLE